MSKKVLCKHVCETPSGPQLACWKQAACLFSDFPCPPSAFRLRARHTHILPPPLREAIEFISGLKNILKGCLANGFAEHLLPPRTPAGSRPPGSFPDFLCLPLRVSIACKVCVVFGSRHPLLATRYIHSPFVLSALSVDNPFWFSTACKARVVLVPLLRGELFDEPCCPQVDPPGSLWLFPRLPRT